PRTHDIEVEAGADMSAPAAAQNPAPAMGQLTRLLRYVRPYSLQLIASVILMAGVGLFDAFRILLIGPIFDQVLNPNAHTHQTALFTFPGTHHTVYLQSFVPEHFQNAWTVVAFALVAATVLKGFCDYAGTYLVNYAGFGMVTDLRDELYNNILRRSVAFFSKHSTGTLISTIVSDVERVQFALSSVLAEFLQQLFILIFTVFVVILLGGRFAWILGLFAPVIIYLGSKIGRRVRHTTRRGQDKLADIQNVLHETITGNRIVKAFSMEKWESERFKGAGKRLFRANLRSVAAAAVSSPVMDILGSIAIALLLLLGRERIKAHLFSTGTFFAFIVAVFKLYDPIRKFALFNNNFQQAVGASSEIFRFLSSKDEVREKLNATALTLFRNNLRFDNVSFSYNSAEPEAHEVLRRINLDVQAGELLAVVGSSGAGKSTLVHLLPRFFDVSAGRLLIDGQDVRDLTLASLRSQIGIVTQETVLFNDTVRNNIAYGQPHVAQEAVVLAAQAALAHDFIQEMPDGYDTVIGERGVRL